MLSEAKIGGDSLLIDGFYCAESLKKHYPEDFEFLTTMRSQAVYKESGKYDVRHSEPVIKVDPLTGTLMQIR